MESFLQSCQEAERSLPSGAFNSTIYSSSESPSTVAQISDQFIRLWNELAQPHAILQVHIMMTLIVLQIKSHTTILFLVLQNFCHWMILEKSVDLQRLEDEVELAIGISESQRFLEEQDTTANL